MSEEIALALVAFVAPFVVQFFRWILNKTGVTPKGVPALVMAGIVAVALAFVAAAVSGELDFGPDGITAVFALAHVVYVALRGRLEEWMPTSV